MQTTERDALLSRIGRRDGGCRHGHGSRSVNSDDIRIAHNQAIDDYGSVTSLDSESLELPNSRADQILLLQASTFLEDAIQYRSIHHKVDEKSLRLYSWYYSMPVQRTIDVVIFLLHILAFLETPSSLVLTTDPRQHKEAKELPCGVTESLELLLLLLLLVDLVVKVYLKGREQFGRSKWLWAYALIIAISLVDWCVSLGRGCTKVVRIRRMLRPFFLLQHSSLMKKTVNCLRRTLPQIASVLLLLLMHLYFFTLFGMLLFPRPSHSKNSTDTEPYKQFKYGNPEVSEGVYFDSLVDSFVNLLVLLTTANNPDVTMPAYTMNRFYAIYFVVFLTIGLYCFMNMLTAVVYNQFRGYFVNSMQASLFRRRLAVRTAYEVLRRRPFQFKHQSLLDPLGQGVPVSTLKMVVLHTKMEKHHKNLIVQELDNNIGGFLDATQFQEVFSILEIDLHNEQEPVMQETRYPSLRTLQKIASHRYFTHFGCFIALINVICISIELILEYDHIQESNNTALGILNLLFVFYYLVEQVLKIWALGWRLYLYFIANIFEGFITLMLVIVELVYVSMYGIPFWGHETGGVQNPVTLWDLVRIINMLIMVRLFRIVTQIKPMLVVVRTMVDLIKNLTAFLGVLVVLFYTYALIGMEIFKDAIPAPLVNETRNYGCGTYEQLNYWANNFNDFGSALVVLWDVMVVNNWHVFLEAYSKYMNKWTQLYFIIWWLLSVIIVMNLFTALILENFIMRWDKWRHRRELHNPRDSNYTRNMTIHEMFREGLQEPSEEELLVELANHAHLSLC